MGVVGCKILDFQGKYQGYSMRRYPTFLNIILYIIKIEKIGVTNFYHYGDYSKDKINFVESISGCCMMFSRIIYNRTKCFNERYFLYFEDTQFCVDIRNIGYNVVYNNQAVISHYGGGSTERLSFIHKNILFFMSFITYFFINIYQ